MSWCITLIPTISPMPWMPWVSGMVGSEEGYRRS